MKRKEVEAFWNWTSCLLIVIGADGCSSPYAAQAGLRASCSSAVAPDWRHSHPVLHIICTDGEAHFELTPRLIYRSDFQIHILRPGQSCQSHLGRELCRCSSIHMPVFRSNVAQIEIMVHLSSFLHRKSLYQDPNWRPDQVDTCSTSHYFCDQMIG